MLHPGTVTATAPASPTRQWLYFGLLMLLLGVPQAILVTGATDMHVDGGLYMDIAMHVRDGDGLVSDVSLYHSGAPWFPYPSPIYPLWPTLLGMLGRFVEITALGHWLPYALYLLSLVGAFLFGRRLFSDERGPTQLGPIRGLNAGHLMVFMLGSQREYSRFTTMPYTEGLAFALFFFTLWRLTKMRPRWGDMIELGVWLSLLCLTRSQMFIAPIAVALALGILAVLGSQQSRRWVLPGLASLAVVGLTLFVWWKHSAGFVLDASPLTLLRFDQARVSDVLTPINVLKDSSGPIDAVVDRILGLGLAWSLLDWDYSYSRGFYAQHWALPIALLFALPALWRLRWAKLRAFLAQPRAFVLLTVGLLALGALATIHLPHKQGFGSWYFHRRHAIVTVLPWFLCMAWLARHHHRLARVAALALVLTTAGFTVESLYYRVPKALAEPEPDRDAELIEWLQQRATAEEPLVVAMYAFKPPELAWRTDHVGYHWFYERTSLEDLRRIFDELGAEYMVVRGTSKWAYREDPKAFRALFEPYTRLDGGVRIYRRKDVGQRTRKFKPPGE